MPLPERFCNLSESGSHTSRRAVPMPLAERFPCLSRSGEGEQPSEILAGFLCGNWISIKFNFLITEMPCFLTCKANGLWHFGTFSLQKITKFSHRVVFFEARKIEKNIMSARSLRHATAPIFFWARALWGTQNLNFFICIFCIILHRFLWIFRRSPKYFFHCAAHACLKITTCFFLHRCVTLKDKQSALVLFFGSGRPWLSRLKEVRRIHPNGARASSAG